LVVDADGKTRIPFLRGILTHSLQEAGLQFDQAYELASSVRDALGDVEEISTKNLRAEVLRQLKRLGNSSAAKKYEANVRAPAPIMVRDSSDVLTPFSRGRHQQRLECSGLSSESAFEITRQVFDHLLKQRISEIRSHHLGGLTYGCLKKKVGENEAHRYLVWAQFVASGRPLILLIGGTAGCGKSTIATEVTSRLGIVRTQSTDMLREVMRMMIPERLMPVLYTSSFNAWQAVSDEMDDVVDEVARLKIGYRRQAELVQVACDAVLQRAFREQASLVLEGVHVRPSLLQSIESDPNAIVVPILLAVLKKDNLRQRIKGRGRQVVQRRAERYLEHFDSIWKLQSELLSEADANDVAIISNEDKESAVRDVMTTIVDRLDDEFTLEPREVFSGQAKKVIESMEPVRIVKPETKKWSLKKPGTWFRSKKA
jgi:2-phosphoglycerate kinase